MVSPAFLCHGKDLKKTANDRPAALRPLPRSSMEQYQPAALRPFPRRGIIICAGQNKK